MNLEALGRLYDYADDVEIEAITEVALRAGLLWQCDCGTYNDGNQANCVDCGDHCSQRKS